MALNETRRGTFDHGGPVISADSGDYMGNKQNPDKHTNNNDVKILIQNP